MNRRPRRRALAIALAAAALALLALAASASAATLTLKCGGPGPGFAGDEASTTTCAAQPGQARDLEGVLRNDQNKPVAGKLNVTFSEWIPQGEGVFDITPFKTIELRANAAGKFSIPVKTTSEVTVFVEAEGDETLAVTPTTLEANVQLQLRITAKKLGGGRVKVAVKGTRTPLKLAIVDEEGYEVTGGRAKKAKNGVAVFSLGSQHGSFHVSVDAGELSDLFWLEPPTIHL